MLALARAHQREPQPAKAGQSAGKNQLYCVLCKRNNESEEVYTGHKLRDENNQITCPVLRQYKCPNCGIQGQHTRGYCPSNPARKASGKPAPRNKPSGPSGGAAAKLLASLPAAAAGQQAANKGHKKLNQALAGAALQLPSFKADKCLTRNYLNYLLVLANSLEPRERLHYLCKNGYNPVRFLAIQRIVQAWHTAQSRERSPLLLL